MDADVVVVGGGVMGLAAAGALARAGASVVLLERFDVGHGRGSSHGPTRVFRFLYDDPLYVRMAQAALPLWRALEEASGESLLRVTGGVLVDDAEAIERHRIAMDAAGADVELLDPDERRERAPWLEADDAASLWAPDLGVIAADATLRVLLELAGTAGVVVREDTRVEAIKAQGDGVRVDDLTARRCVVAAGAWTPELLSLDVPLRVTREQVVYFRAVEDVTPFAYGVGHWIYGVPPFFEGDALKVAEHGTGPEVAPDDRTFDLDEAAAERVCAFVRKRLPDVDPEPIGFETCLYTLTPNNDFVIDNRGPVVVVSACSGHGFKFAPLIGEIAAALALGHEPPMHIERFSLSRY